MQKRYFTIEEAEEELPRIRKLLAKIQRLKERIGVLAGARSQCPEEIDEVESEQDAFSLAFTHEVRVNRELHRLAHEFYKALDELNDTGCVIKDLDEGLIDFYFPLDDRDVLLCWKTGERRIAHWHEVDEGFAGRRPVVDLDELE